MRFAVALPWWGYALAFAAAVVFAWLAYARVAVPLSRSARALLTSLRALTLLLIVLFLLRPVQVVPAEGARDSVVAILVDGSRSMRLADDGTARIDRARAIAEQLQRDLGSHFQFEILSFGESLARTEIAQLSADARRSDLTAALRSVSERFRGRQLAGIVVVSDGGDTTAQDVTGAGVAALSSGEGATVPGRVPIFTVGVGSARVRDREVVNFTAGEPLLSGSSVDLSVSLSTAGLGTAPVDLRLTENGRPLETRRVTPSADVATLHEVFTVSPAPDRSTVYAVTIPVAADEIVGENNTRSVLVPPQGRRRKVLIVEGAPGFEHTFLKRALARDAALEVDSVVRKGQDETGRDTFFIQAASSRANALSTGYPTRRADLYAYDAVFFGNIAGDFFSRDQLEMTAEFVGTRGGGLLVFGARSFERAGLVGTPLEEVLPIDFTDRQGSIARTAGSTAAANTLALTADGAAHPATRLALSIDENRRRWSQLPALAAVAAAGGPRAGAQVLAVTGGAGGTKPLLIAQRYGNGRSMVFSGEAAWRWRMLMPATDTTHELVWRQIARWVAGGSTERVEIPANAVALPGTTENIRVVVRDEEFTPVGNAEVALRVTAPGGEERTMPAALTDPAEGRYTAAVRFDQPGVFRVVADVRRGGEPLGTATRAVLVGGVDIELSEPALNESLLRRIADTSGGRYVRAEESSSIAGAIADIDVGNRPTELRDLWHNGYSLLAIIILLGLEWLLRRRVGLA
jgi:uncharacterized membrane protein